MPTVRINTVKSIHDNSEEIAIVACYGAWAWRYRSLPCTRRCKPQYCPLLARARARVLAGLAKMPGKLGGESVGGLNNCIFLVLHVMSSASGEPTGLAS